LEDAVGEDYRDWHTGVEFDRESRSWRGFIRKADTDQKEYTAQRFDNKEDAAVAASDLLTTARSGAAPG
jgi:hypothetical protein